jgi:hypothetical protein
MWHIWVARVVKLIEFAKVRKLVVKIEKNVKGIKEEAAKMQN